MAESSLALTNRLLNIKGFSDFTLICHGQKFGLHKAIVCLQSSVMANNLRSGPGEATANILYFPFDIESVKRLLEFMYTGDYKLSPDPALELLSLGMSRDSGVEFAIDSPKSGSNNGRDDLSSAPGGLACHARMDSIASYYDIPPLGALAISKINKALANEWSADSFCDLVRDSLDSTSDQYHRMLAAKAVEHVDELAERRIFDKGGAADRLTPYSHGEFESGRGSGT
ncbi:hypothetical protein F5Y12DRAFT_719579 [Xylaria sp. FL1777]|nr:hypothetical protein F5Y12DRAFT_719579 [Xylaria sp. FL1777]